MKVIPTWRVHVYVAGDLNRAIELCREECWRDGLCVTIVPTYFVYTGGMETGVIVSLTNYPRFPKEETEITERAIQVAKFLIAGLFQKSAMVETSIETIWITQEEVSNE